MNTYKALQLVAAGALAFCLNGLATAHTVDLNADNAQAKGSVATIASAGGVSLHAMQTPANRNVIRTGVRNGGFIFHSNDNVSCVPEPSEYLLMLVGVGLVGFMAYRRQRHFSSMAPVLSAT